MNPEMRCTTHPGQMPELALTLDDRDRPSRMLLRP
jgi:hypothetical protein